MELEEELNLQPAVYKSVTGGLLKFLIGAVIPLLYAVLSLLPLCFFLSLSASMQPDLLTPLTP